MGIQLVVQAKFGANGEFIFSVPLAPAPRTVAPPLALGEEPLDESAVKVLPSGSSLIAPGLSVAIPL